MPAEVASPPPASAPAKTAQAAHAEASASAHAAKKSLLDGIKGAMGADKAAEPPRETRPPEQGAKPVEQPAKGAETSPAKEPVKAPSAFDKVKPAEAAKPAEEVDHFAHIKPPENLSESAQTGWKALKTEAANKLKAAEQRYADAQAQLETYKKATPADMAELTRLKGEHAAAMERLSVLDLESHPDFQSQYSKPQQKALEEARMLLGDNGVTDAPDFNALLSKPRAEFAKAVSEMAGKMQDFDKAGFTAAMREAYRLNGEKREALGKASELRTGMEAKTAAEQRKAFEETWGKIGDADAFLQSVEIPEGIAPEERAELTAYNQSVQTVRGEAEKYAFGRLDARQAAAVASKAAALDFMVKTAVPRMNKEYATVRAERDALAAELRKINEAKKPGTFQAGKESTPTPPGEQKPWREGLRDLYKT